MDEGRDVLGESIGIAMKVNDWIKKNWLTVVGIIIILSIVWYDQANLQPKIKEAVDECNAHWHDEIERSCPLLVEHKYVYFNASKVK